MMMMRSSGLLDISRSTEISLTEGGCILANISVTKPGIMEAVCIRRKNMIYKMAIKGRAYSKEVEEHLSKMGMGR